MHLAPALIEWQPALPSSSANFITVLVQLAEILLLMLLILCMIVQMEVAKMLLLR